MQIHNKIATDLSSILAKKFDKLTIANEQAQSTIEPDAGRIFTLEYSGSGKSYGSVTVNIVDPDTLVVYYNNNITEDMRYDDKKDWYTFLKELRYFAKRNLMGFDVRNIGKQQLDKKDYAYIKQNDASPSVDDVTESKLHGSIKTSYQDIGEVRVVIKHSKPVDEEKRGSRTRQIHSLFIENSAKERTKFPFRFLAGARAMAQHVNQGGDQVDELGQHIHEMNQEVIDLKKFVKAFRRADNFAEQDEAQSIIEQAKERATGLVATLKTLSGPKGYKTYVEQYEPTESTVEQADLDDIRSKLVRIERDNIVDSVLPSLARGIKTMNEKQVDEAEPALSQADIDFEKEQDAKIANRAQELIKFAKAPDDIEIQNNPGSKSALEADMEVVKHNSKMNTQQKNHNIVMQIMDYLEKNVVDSDLANAIGNIDYDNKQQTDAAMGVALKYLKGKVKMTAPAEKRKLKKEEVQLEDWANNLIEGTWTIPDTAEAIEALEKLFLNPLPVGPDAQNASNALGNIIGNDSLFDDLGELSDEDPNADARKIIQTWVLANIQSYDIDEQLIKRAMVAVDYDDGTTDESVEEDMNETIPYMFKLQQDGKSIEEIAKELNMTVDAVRSAMSKQHADEDVAQESYSESMLQCKDCGDTLGNPTTDCEHDCNDPNGANWVKVDVDGDGDDDIAVKQEDTTELDTLKALSGLVDEDSEEITNTGREEELSNIDRGSVTLDMVKPAIEKMLASYEADANEWNNAYTELEKEVRAKGVTDPKQIQTDVFNMDDDIVSYTNIDDLEDKIDAIKRLMKQGDADGNDIVDLASSGPSDTIAREDFMQELKHAIKQGHSEVYSKLFMYDIGESMDENQPAKKVDTVQVEEIDAVALMQRLSAALNGTTEKNANEGYKVLPSMPDKYVARDGLEGPIMTGSGKVVYYDNAEGKYYDPDTDMYMSYEEWKALDPDLPIKEDESANYETEINKILGLAGLK